MSNNLHLPYYFIDPIASEQDPRGDMIVLAEEWMAEKAWEVISKPLEMCERHNIR